MRIGYLHLAPHQNHESGIVRYGRYIAQAVQAQALLGTQEVTIALDDHADFRPELKQALGKLQSCDVLHFQYSKYLGLAGWKKLQLLKLIRQNFAGKLCVTLHDIYQDIYPNYGWVKAWEFENRRLRSFSKHKSLALRSTAVYLWQNHLADQAIMAWLLTHGEHILVCNQAEAERLKHFPQSDKITVIPHFVEGRAPLLSPAEAKARLGLGSEKIVTLQGFIYRSKGHQLLLNALSLLPKSIQVIFAGGMAPNQDGFKRELETQIQQLALGDRVKITGYLSEPDLELYLAATDLAVCPFQIASASGSLSTWISMERPILAYDLPQVQELNALAPGALATFSDYSPESLAEAIAACLDSALAAPPAGGWPSPIQQLKQQLSLEQIAQQHGRLYAGEPVTVAEQPSSLIPVTAPSFE
jgi:glycosyltransferase involved in cell wall biosynthesis